MPRRKAEVVQYPIYLGLGVKGVAERGEKLPAFGARQRDPAGAAGIGTAGIGPAGFGDGGFVLLAVSWRFRRWQPAQPGDARNTEPGPPLRRVLHPGPPVGVGGIVLQRAQWHGRDGGRTLP